jgi:hypothetical protein
MRAKWERVIAANMELIEVPGKETPLYKPVREGGFVWVIALDGEFPTPPQAMERQDLIPRGGRDLDLDASDPDFLVVRKVVGMMEYTHCIPWENILDILFMKRTI